MTPALLACTSTTLLLLAAHVFRAGDWGLAAATIGTLPLIATRLAWIRIILAAAFSLGILDWTRSGLLLLQIRLTMGAPWIRLSLILGLALLLLLLSLALILGKAGQRWFHRQPDKAWGEACVFGLVVGVLTLTSRMVPFPLLLAERYLPGSGPLEIWALGVYAVAMWHAVHDPKRHRQLRPLLWGGFSAVFFLQLALGLLGLNQMLMTGTLHLPIPALILAGPVYRGEGLFMLGLFLTTIAMVGPAWCSHLCYIGSWDLGCAVLAHTPPRPLGPWPWIARGITLIVVLGVAWIMRTLGLPHTTAGAAALAFGLTGCGIMLLASRRLGTMAHCTLWCPLGLVATILGRLIPWRVAINDHCTACGRCARACRASAITAAHIQAKRPGLSCTLCGDCLAACPHGAIEYRCWSHPWPRARETFLVLVIALHTIFLGLARI